MGVKRPLTQNVASDWFYYKEKITAAQPAFTLVTQGENKEGQFRQVIFDIGILTGAGSYRPQVLFWNPLLEQWIAEKAYSALSVASRVKVIETDHEAVALRIIEMTPTDAPFELVIAWRGIY